jgi:hypothetical protein
MIPSNADIQHHNSVDVSLDSAQGLALQSSPGDESPRDDSLILGHPGWCQAMANIDWSYETGMENYSNHSSTTPSTSTMSNLYTMSLSQVDEVKTFPGRLVLREAPEKNDNAICQIPGNDLIHVSLTPLMNRSHKF